MKHLEYLYLRRKNTIRSDCEGRLTSGRRWYVRRASANGLVRGRNVIHLCL